MNRPFPKSEDGFALLTVIWALGLMMVLITVFSLTSRTLTKTVGNLIANTQTRLDAESGLRLGILALLEQRVGKTGLEVALNTFRCRLNNGTELLISISDEAGKIDLNAASVGLLTALLETELEDPHEARAIAYSILDFRDSDNVRHPHGAENNEYEKAGLGWGPKNAAFFRTEELEQVYGMTEDIFRKIRPHLTVHSMQSGIDPSRTSQKLRSLVEGLKSDPRSQGIILVSRSSQSFFTVRAETLSSSAPKAAYEAIIQLPRDRNPAYQILTWQQVESSADLSTETEAALSACPV